MAVMRRARSNLTYRQSIVSRREKRLKTSDRLNANIKLTLHKALIRSVMTYARPTREIAADTCFLKLHRLQHKIPHTTGNFPRFTPIRDLHAAFNLPYIYDYITEFYRQQAEVIHNQQNEHIRSVGQYEARLRKYKRLKLGSSRACDRSR
jgi:hypothetical protein